MKNNFLVKNIFITFIVILLLSIVPCINSKPVEINQECYIAESNNIILRDDFNNESNNWFWRDIFSGSHSIKLGFATFTILSGDPNKFHVSEIWSNDSSPYLYNNFKARISVDKLTRGSRGWGFWNSNLSLDNCSLVWFIYNRANIFSPFNGFWAMCIDGIQNGFSLKRIRNVDLTKWHDYEINWTENSVDFYIDGKNVAHLTRGIPTQKCRIHVWIDNMRWLPPMKPQRVLLPTSLYLDYIEITE